MPLKYFQLLSFSDKLNKLLKRPRDGYTSCPLEIKNFLCNRSIDQHIDEIRLKVNNDKYLLKTRLPNSQQKLGKSNGFRLIYLLDVSTESLTLLYVYPKRGKFSEENISDSMIEKLLMELINKAYEGFELEC